MPDDSHKFERFSIALTPEQYASVKAKMVEDHKNPNFKFSALKHNCTSYVRRLLKNELNIRIASRMGILEYLTRFFAPKRVFNWGRSNILGLPKFLYKAVHFFPPYYILNAVAGLVLKLFMTTNIWANAPDYYIHRHLPTAMEGEVSLSV